MCTRTRKRKRYMTQSTPGVGFTITVDDDANGSIVLQPNGANNLLFPESIGPGESFHVANGVTPESRTVTVVAANPEA